MRPFKPWNLRSARESGAARSMKRHSLGIEEIEKDDGLRLWPRSGGLIRLVKARATEAAGLAREMPCRPCKRPILRRARPGGASKLVRGAEAAPVPAIDADRHVDLAHHDGFAVAHVAGVALDQVGAQVAAGGEARGIAEDATVAAVGAVPHHIAGALRMRVDFVVDR